MDENGKLQKKIASLEQKLEQKDSELLTFKRELNALNEQIEDLIDKLNKQLQISHGIQKKLVPTEFPHIPGFEFSTKFQASYEAGGDYFDIFEIEDKFRFSMLLSSCSGYGISSLFLSILLKLTSQIETKKGAPPEKVVGQIAKELVQEISEKDSANIFYALINRRSYEISYSHYGDNLVYYYDSNKKEITELEPHGSSITNKFKGKAKSDTLSLNPKDCLIMVSEGVKKVKNNKGVNLSSSQILKLLENKISKGPHELRNEVFYQIQKYQGKKELPKDVTVLVAEVKDRVLKLAK